MAPADVAGLADVCLSGLVTVRSEQEVDANLSRLGQLEELAEQRARYLEDSDCAGGDAGDSDA